MENIRVIIVDDHVIFRNGLMTILQRMEGIQVISECNNGQELLDLLPDVIPDLILMDIRMPVLNGIEATARALEIVPDIRIMALSMFGEEEYLHQMIEAGVCGFLLKNIKKPELQQAIHKVINGGQYFSPELIPYFTKRYLVTKKQEVEHFTPREMDILQLISKGMTTKEMADTLFISKRTVEGHRANLIEKTGSKNVVNLLIYAIKHGLVNI